MLRKPLGSRAPCGWRSGSGGEGSDRPGPLGGVVLSDCPCKAPFPLTAALVCGPPEPGVWVPAGSFGTGEDRAGSRAGAAHPLTARTARVSGVDVPRDERGGPGQWVLESAGAPPRQREARSSAGSSRVAGRSRAWEVEGPTCVASVFRLGEVAGDGTVPGVGGCRADLWARVEWQAGFRAVAVDFKPVSGRGRSELGLPERRC